MYYIVYGFLYVLSLLPLRILYFFSDGIYVLVYYIIGYRKNIVMSNLKIAFPEKTDKERVRIAKDFYHNFIDTFIETIKMISIRKNEVNKRSTGDFELINNLYDKGFNIHLMLGHQFNWEFANLLYAIHLKIPFVGIYMPISNKILDRIFYKFRSKYGTVLISATDFKNKMHTVFTKQYMLGLGADQNPGNPKNAYWMNFFGKPTPFVTGPGKGGVKNKTAVVYIGFEKIKRGQYKFNATLLADKGADYTPQQLTLFYKNALEQTIRRDPANYLWSHRRWKWEWKEEYKDQWVE
ncbi:MAG: lipid A biosynthesis acyltransferase [Sphingobacteriales bacterium]|nr:lipid A biosynthesis acyltransferase [Sphingobacteriales bacterium]